MMIDFLFSLPLWALAIVLNVWLMGFSLASLWALRRWVLPRLHLNTNASLERLSASWRLDYWSFLPRPPRPLR